MSDLKLSIIIPCYNCDQTLREAVDSCYVQGFRDDQFEIVMVDDCSTDDTKTLMQKLASEHSNVRCLFNEKNQGGGATRNTAIKSSRGEVIFPLDGDDILPSGTLLKMYNFLKEKKCDGAAIERSIKFEGEDTTKINHVDVSAYPEGPIPFVSLLKLDRFCPLVINFMYTREAFEKTLGYPTVHGFDTPGFAWGFLTAGLIAYTCPGSEYLHRMKFSESYYLREYNGGKINYNWRDIFIEYYYVFTPEALDFIQKFNCGDFTRNIMDELQHKNNVLIPDILNVLGKQHPPLNISFPAPVYIPRNSLRGYFLRLRNKVMSLLK